LSGHAESWDALDQAILIAQRDQAVLHGLHVVDGAEDVESAEALGMKARFDLTCEKAGVQGSLAIDVGNITPRICERAVATDLIVLKMANPPAWGITALQSPFRTILEKSSRPLIAVPGAATRFERAVLAFDGSDRAKEALFVATYLAEMWGTRLTVFTALESARVKSQAQDYAQRYFEIHEVQAEFILSDRNAADSLKRVSEEHNADLVLMGSHGGSALTRVFVGSLVDAMMRESQVPLFICR
jgi:nucleotide-binding universal stress UspA family protein